MKHLSALNKYFWKYRVRLFAGILFVIASNYFAVLAPEITGYVVGQVQQHLPGAKHSAFKEAYGKLTQLFLSWISKLEFSKLVLICCITILLLALLRGLLMFFMRQTIIVMSRHIEYDLKNDIYNHYQKLDSTFFKTHSTGDLMNRIAEDVSRVRMYAGPAIMYLTNLVALISFCLVNMLRKDVHLTLIVFAPLPLLALLIYFINTLIHKKSEKVQSLLSLLTTNAQESYSGIRVIKSFVQEKAMLGFFKRNSEAYRKNAVSLAKVDAIYFPGISLMIGLSTLLTILIGGQLALNDPQKVGTIVEFVIYINMLTFPVSSVGWVASMVQRASASQKRVNEFLNTEPAIKDEPRNFINESEFNGGDIVFSKVTFTYPHTGITAIKNFSLEIKEGQKILILGKTGSGKSTLAQLLLRFYVPDEGKIKIGKKDISIIPLHVLRNYISYVPQDVFLFSDTVNGNINFGSNKLMPFEAVQQAARNASIDAEIQELQKGYETAVGERGVTLSGGQKQRISIARALLKKGSIMLFDDCLSSVDAKTENQIIHNLDEISTGKTTIIITHRIFTAFNFSKIVVIDEGEIIEQGTHEELMYLNGYYRQLYHLQIKKAKLEET
ncbi:MAG: ABC transporter ATP-binding protein [Parafilimonas sp.]